MSWNLRKYIVLSVLVLGLGCSRSGINADPNAVPVPVHGPIAASDVPSPRPVPLTAKGSEIPFPNERADVPPPNPKLPPVPYVHGKLEVNVVYPPKNAVIASRDSSFIHGSIGTGYAGLRINGQLVPVWPNGAFMGFVANPKSSPRVYEIVAYTAKDTVTVFHPVRMPQDLPPSTGPRPVSRTFSPSQLIQLTGGSLDPSIPDIDKAVIGRPTPTGTYRWFLFPGTVARRTAQQGNMVKVLLDAGREIWVNEKDVGPFVSDRAAVREKIEIKDARVIPHNDWLDFQFRINQPPAYAVEQPDENTITLIFYNASTDPDEPIWVASQADPYLTKTSVSKSANRVVYKFFFSRPVYGYLPIYEDGMMTFRMRRPPFVSRDNPLRDLIIAVDAGHPPAGSTGPTGLYEAVPNLAVAQRLKNRLEEQGAIVVMTRKDDKPLGLVQRTVIARQGDAHALVSIHLNAVPDGVNPFRANGTSTYYFQPHSRRLATVMQRALVPQMGLRDLGAFHSNLALVRPTWMPSVLTEGAFMIMPDQEAAMRTPEYQDAYATGVVNGLISFFQAFAR